MPLAPGTKLGPYEILAPIGEGGMGEVYRARDTRLNRDVALKVLPADFASDPSRRRRFEQEARAVAALNHPNIVAVYDVGENFLVSELVEGQTLRAAGMLSQRQAVDLAVQIAEGLAAAHAAGITHRDLKPGNIMITREGRAKILDFGLAKVTAPRENGVPPDGESTQTESGMVLGTVGYMSPEQVRAQPADARSDIFSFGLVFYEMLAGKRAFAGASSIEVMSAILKEEPPELPASVAPGLRRIVEHCLEKNPDRRFQSARDLAFSLQAPPSAPAPAAIPVVPKIVPRWRVAGLLAAMAVVAAVASRMLWPAPEPPVWNGVMLGGPETAIDPHLSPDGHLLAFLAMVDGLTQVAVMKPETGNWTILTQDRSRGPASAPSWSPDGALIYYTRAHVLHSVPVLGGDSRPLLENAAYNAALPDGTLLFTRMGSGRHPGLYRFWPGTGRVQDLPVDLGINSSENTAARAHPDGKTTLVWGSPKGHAGAPALYALDLASGSMKRVSPEGLNGDDLTAFAVAADGKSVVAAVNSGTLTRIVSYPLNGAATERTLFTVTATVWFLDAAADGSLYASMFDRPADLVRFAKDGSRYEKLASFPVAPEEAAIMTVLPDGRAVVAVRASGQNRLMAVRQGKDPEPLVNTAEETMAPVSPCGSSEVAFVIGPAPHETIAFTEPATGRIVRKIGPGKGPVDSISCSPDGATVYFAAREVIWRMPASGGDVREVRPGGSVVADPSGRQLIVKAVEGPEEHLYRIPLDGGPESEIRLDDSIRLARSLLASGSLNADGGMLTPLAPGDSWFNPPGVIDTATGRITRIPGAGRGDYRSMGWTKDGEVIALVNGLRATLWKFTPVALKK